MFLILLAGFGLKSSSWSVEGGLSLGKCSSVEWGDLFGPEYLNALNRINKGRGGVTRVTPTEKESLQLEKDREFMNKVSREIRESGKIKGNVHLKLRAILGLRYGFGSQSFNVGPFLMVGAGRSSELAKIGVSGEITISNFFMRAGVGMSAIVFVVTDLVTNDKSKAVLPSVSTFAQVGYFFYDHFYIAGMIEYNKGMSIPSVKKEESLLSNILLSNGIAAYITVGYSSTGPIEEVEGSELAVPEAMAQQGADAKKRAVIEAMYENEQKAKKVNG